MSQPARSDDSQRVTDEPAAPSGISLRPHHRRLARLVYATPFLRGRKVLLALGDRTSNSDWSALLSLRGAREVAHVTLEPDLSVTQSVERLSQARGPFDLIYIELVAALCTPPIFEALRRQLAQKGHVLITARSRESAAPGPDAIGYFELADGLSAAGLGAVAMLGQSCFLGTTVVPFGAGEPSLVFDDTLVASEQPDEYIALCGELPSGGLPYQVVKLPSLAAVPPVAKPSVDTSPWREQAESAQAAKRLVEAQKVELEERLRQRDRSDQEANKAALVHEKEMRRLRQTLEEREAFVAELEEHARELPRLQEELAKAQKQLDASQQSERQAQKKLAEVEGQLLRARGELNAEAQQDRAKDDLESSYREIEEMRRELAVQRAEHEQAEQALLKQRAAMDATDQALQGERAEHERVRKERAELERVSSSRDAALVEVRTELLTAQNRLQQLHAELEQRTHALTEAENKLQQQAAALAVMPPLTNSDGVPLLVGDIPTRPVSLHGAGGEISLQKELAQLRQRLSELAAENERLKDKATEAERETWRHMKARSEAEQAAAEVREDTVRKLRDARKLASAELTRAMEDATKKAVSVRDELSRTEAERKEAVAQIKELRAARDAAQEQLTALKQEMETQRWASTLPDSRAASSQDTQTSIEEVARAKEEGERALSALAEERSARQAAQQAADQAQSRIEELRAAGAALERALNEAREGQDREQRRVEALEDDLRQAGPFDQRSDGGEFLQLQQDLQLQTRALYERTAERDALSRLLTEVEREPAARAERARALRMRLSEREREVEALRAELSERERKLAVYDQQAGQSHELSRLSSELGASRQRISELLEEAARREQHGDDAVATALRERARAMRSNESLEQTAKERDEALSRGRDLEQQFKEALAESERLRAELLRVSTPSTLGGPELGGGAGVAMIGEAPSAPHKNEE